MHCTQAPLSTSLLPVAHTAVEPLQPLPSSAHEHCRQPLGVVGVPVQRAGTLVLDVTHAVSSWLQSFWTVQVLAPTVMVVSWALHRSPISPHRRPFAYHAMGKPTVLVSPISVSVVASASSCECTAVALAIQLALVPHPVAHPPLLTSGMTP